jgi:hypothetical protein
VFIFVNFSFALFTPPLGDYQHAFGEATSHGGGNRTGVRHTTIVKGGSAGGGGWQGELVGGDDRGILKGVMGQRKG